MVAAVPREASGVQYRKLCGFYQTGAGERFTVEIAMKASLRG